MFSKTIRIILGCFLVAEGVVLTFGLPPFQKFDETVHFTRTIALSRGQLFCQNGHLVIPKVYENLQEKYNFQKVLLENEKFPNNLVDWGKKWTADDLKETVEIGGCQQNFLGYIPNTLGIWLTGWTNRPAIIFYAGRIFGVLFLGLMLKIGLKIINKKFGYLLWFYALMPMVVHQATAFSYDVVIVVLVLPLTALWVNRLNGQKFRGIDWALVCLMVSAMAIIKPVYLPLFFLYGVKDWSWKFKIRELVTVGLMAGLVLGIGRIGKGESDYPTFVNPKLQLQLIENDPIYFLEVVVNTWQDKFMAHFEEMVGVMGWRNTPMVNNYLNFVFLISAVWVVMRLVKDLKKKTDGRQLPVILGVILAVTFLTTLVMYLISSLVGDKSVEGIQGRYWLPLIPSWLVLIGGAMAYAKERRWLRNLILVLVLVGVLVNISQSLRARYFDWSKNWVNNLNPSLPTTGLTVIEKEVNLVKESSGENVSGIALNLDNRNKSIIIPYQYRITDGEGKKILRRGYLRPWDIQGEKQMVLEFRPITAEKGKLCLKLIPLKAGAGDYKDRLTIKLTDGQPQMEWLNF